MMIIHYSWPYILVAVGREKVGVESGQIKREMPNAMRPVDKRENSLLPSKLGQSFKRQPHTGETSDRVKHSNPRLAPMRVQGIRKPLHNLLLGARDGELDLDTLGGRRLDDVVNRILDRPVHRVDVDNDVSWLEDEVAEDGVDGGRDVGHDDEVVPGHLQVIGGGLSCHVEVARVLVADVPVGGGFGGVLEGPHGIADGADGASKGACLGNVSCLFVSVYQK